MELKLARIWSEALGVDGVGAHDNFFEIGGDSLLTIQVASHAVQEGLPVTPRAIFEFKTVDALLDRSVWPQQKADAGESVVAGDRRRHFVRRSPSR